MSGARVLRSMITTVAGNVGVLTLNLATGVLSARLLEPEGRGTFAAVSVFVVIAAALGQNGLSDAGTYFAARERERAGAIASTCVALVSLLAVITSVLALVAVPVVFAAQPRATVDVARLAVLATGAVMLAQLGLGLTAGLKRFTALALYRLCQPLLFLVGLVTLAVTGRATAGSALVVFLGSYAVLAGVVLISLLWSLGWRRPELSLARSLAGYGVRLQGQIVGNVGNTRLDLAILPAVVAAAEIGLYSVAVSVASIVIALFATLGGVVSPLATTGDRAVAMRLVERTTRMVLVAASLCALGLAVLGPWLLTFAYGEAYRNSVDPLRLLLPGCVFLAASYLLSGALRAIGRPGATSIVPLLGLMITVPGLLLTIPRFGIVGAAATSSVAYCTVFVGFTVQLGRASPFRPRAIVDVGEFRRDLQWLAAAVGGRLGRSGAIGQPVTAVPAGLQPPRSRAEVNTGTRAAPVLAAALHREGDMQNSTATRSPWALGALVVVPAIFGASVSGLLALADAEPRQRATGVVLLSEIAGNAPSGQLNPYAADLETTLQSAPVRQQVRDALGPQDEPSAVEVVRLPDASRVSISLEADDEQAARTALLAAGRAGYSALVAQQTQLLEVRERAALTRLQGLAEQVSAARAALDAAPEAEAVAAASVVQQSERLVAIAVDELSQVQGNLAIAQELAAGTGATDAVVVDAVEPVSPLSQSLPVVVAGFLGGALAGGTVAWLLRRRAARRSPSSVEGQQEVEREAVGVPASKPQLPQPVEDFSFGSPWPTVDQDAVNWDSVDRDGVGRDGVGRDTVSQDTAEQIPDEQVQVR